MKLSFWDRCFLTALPIAIFEAVEYTTEQIFGIEPFIWHKLLILFIALMVSILATITIIKWLSRMFGFKLP